ncbi:hypothetical protein LJR039_003130 [Pseudorhodoferax sp. LjRoot39]
MCAWGLLRDVAGTVPACAALRERLQAMGATPVGSAAAVLAGLVAAATR